MFKFVVHQVQTGDILIKNGTVITITNGTLTNARYLNTRWENLQTLEKIY